MGASWAASDEASKSQWVTYTFRDTSGEPLNCCGGFNELIFGLLDSGEFLIDDISVIGNPDSSRVQMMQNGSFQGDAIGSVPNRYRLIGTHSD